MDGCGWVPVKLDLQKQDRSGLARGRSLPTRDADSGELSSVLEQTSSLLGEDGCGSSGWQRRAPGREDCNSLGSGSPTELWLLRTQQFS